MAPLGVSENSQFFLLCSAEHKRKNWKLIDTVHGAEASAILYSIVETAKANELNIYQYFKYLLTEIPKHMDNTDLDFIEDLLPYSKQLPDECRKKNTAKSK